VYVSPALHTDLAPYLASEFGISDVHVLAKMPGDLSQIEGRIVSSSLSLCSLIIG